MWHQCKFKTYECEFIWEAGTKWLITTDGNPRSFEGGGNSSEAFGDFQECQLPNLFSGIIMIT